MQARWRAKHQDSEKSIIEDPCYFSNIEGIFDLSQCLARHLASQSFYGTNNSLKMFLPNFSSITDSHSFMSSFFEVNIPSLFSPSSKDNDRIYSHKVLQCWICTQTPNFGKFLGSHNYFTYPTKLCGYDISVKTEKSNPIYMDEKTEKSNPTYVDMISTIRLHFA